MTIQPRVAGLGAVLALCVGGTAEAQGYRVRLDLRSQGAAFRGVDLDSVPASQVVTGPDGGLQSAEGFAVRCSTITPYCLFFRPGPIRRGAPVTGAADLAVWGLGLPGLSLRATARANADLSGSDYWPGTRPHFELLEGYGEYAAGWLTARAGRVQSLNRLGAVGYDGATLTVRDGSLGLDASAFAGLGLARAAAIPINSPLLDPLDQYQPSQRQLVAGGSVGWGNAFSALRLSYQREVDRRSRYFISERWALEGSLRPPVPGLAVSGAADWDLANNWLGSAEGLVAFTRGPLAASVGGRRYRPHFDLWTIWGAFSPVPYHAGTAAVRVAAARQLAFSARGELYRYDPSEAESGLVEVEDHGWRWSLQADASPTDRLDLTLGYGRELGPGAASATFDAAASYQQGGNGWVTVNVARLRRPLELRFDESNVWMAGVRGEVRPNTRVAVSAGASGFHEIRDRPDAARIDWDQVRFDVRFTVHFGSQADANRLPPAVPSGGGVR